MREMEAAEPSNPTTDNADRSANHRVGTISAALAAMNQGLMDSARLVIKCISNPCFLG
jgi:hypothetical protein